MIAVIFQLQEHVFKDGLCRTCLDLAPREYLGSEKGTDWHPFCDQHKPLNWPEHMVRLNKACR